ncbi:MAG: sigma-70 family RNA polymerase sigma factor [Acidobacteriota bacterium]
MSSVLAIEQDSGRGQGSPSAAGRERAPKLDGGPGSSRATAAAQPSSDRPSSDQPSSARPSSDLARRAQAGDAAAADRLYELARQRLTRIALALGAPPDDVPDLVQEVLVAAWRNLERFDPDSGSFVGWLVPGLRGRVHNRGRANGRRQRFLGRLRELVPWRSSAPATQGAVEARMTLERLLEGLTDRQREVVALYEIEGLSAQETASLLGMTAAGVRSIARDARLRLRREAERRDLPGSVHSSRPLRRPEGGQA